MNYYLITEENLVVTGKYYTDNACAKPDKNHIPVTKSQYDTTDTANCVIVNGVPVNNYPKPAAYIAKLWDEVRVRRNAKLAACDWTQLPDAPATIKQAWATYRQALRDVTLQADPLNITWPVPPA